MYYSQKNLKSMSGPDLEAFRYQDQTDDSNVLIETDSCLEVRWSVVDVLFWWFVWKLVCNKQDFVLSDEMKGHLTSVWQNQSMTLILLSEGSCWITAFCQFLVSFPY